MLNHGNASMIFLCDAGNCKLYDIIHGVS